MHSDERLAVDLLARTDYGRVATSMRALPFLAFARHIVEDGRVLLRLPRSCGYHRAEAERFGAAPRLVDGVPYEPVHLRIEPRFGTVHSADDGLERHFAHML